MGELVFLGRASAPNGKSWRFKNNKSLLLSNHYALEHEVGSEDTVCAASFGHNQVFTGRNQLN